MQQPSNRARERRLRVSQEQLFLVAVTADVTQFLLHLSDDAGIAGANIAIAAQL